MSVVAITSAAGVGFACGPALRTGIVANLGARRDPARDRCCPRCSPRATTFLGMPDFDPPGPRATIESTDRS